MYERILVAIGVIFLIFFIVKFCEKEPSEPSSFDSIYEESQEETSTYDNSDSAVTRKREYSFPEYNSDTDEIDDEYEGWDYDDYDTNWFDDYDEDDGDYDFQGNAISKIDNFQQKYFTSILLDKWENACYNNKAVARERELRKLVDNGNRETDREIDRERLGLFKKSSLDKTFEVWQNEQADCFGQAVEEKGKKMWNELQFIKCLLDKIDRM